MFSRKLVLELEDVVQDKASKLSNRIESGTKDGDPEGVDLHFWFRAVMIMLSGTAIICLRRMILGNISLIW